MLKSMTGYGHADKTLNGRKITVELRSVNHRYLDLSVRCPRAYGFLEEPVKSMVQSATARGKVDIFITIETSPSENVHILLNRQVLERYLEAFYTIRDEYSLTDDITVTRVARFPEIFEITKEEEDAQTLKTDVLCALEEAIAEFNRNARDRGRKTEGRRLRAHRCDFGACRKC